MKSCFGMASWELGCNCSALRKEDGTYAPAHLLYDIRMERAGRNSICEDSSSAPTGATSRTELA